MNLESVKFPALVIADDGWVEYAKTAAPLRKWGILAISKYNSRRVILFDSQDRAWRVKRISPLKPIGFLSKVLAHLWSSSPVAISMEIEQVDESPIAEAKTQLNRAIDADDDILTQWTSAKTLKGDLGGARTFGDVVDVLKRRRAI